MLLAGVTGGASPRNSDQVMEGKMKKYLVLTMLFTLASYSGAAQAVEQGGCTEPSQPKLTRQLK